MLVLELVLALVLVLVLVLVLALVLVLVLGFFHRFEDFDEVLVVDAFEALDMWDKRRWNLSLAFGLSNTSRVLGLMLPRGRLIMDGWDLLSFAR